MEQSNLSTSPFFGVERPFVWDNTTTIGRELKVLLNQSVEPHSISTAGDIVGRSVRGTGLESPLPPTKGFLLSHTGTFTSPQPLTGGETSKAAATSENGLIVGQADAGDKNHQFPVSWRDEVATNLGELPGGTFGAAVGVYDSGVAVGFSTTPVGGSHVVMFANSTVTDLNFPASGKANAINDADTIVGTRGTRAYRYQARQAVDLNKRIRPWASSFSRSLTAHSFAP